MALSSTRSDAATSSEKDPERTSVEEDVVESSEPEGDPLDPELASCVSVSGTLYTAGEDDSASALLFAGAAAAAAESASAAFASAASFASAARESSSSSQDPAFLRARRSANSRTNASCARDPKSQLRLSNARASSTSMPRETRQQLTIDPVRPMPALQWTNMGRFETSSAT